MYYDIGCYHKYNNLLCLGLVELIFAVFNWYVLHSFHSRDAMLARVLSYNHQCVRVRL